MKQIIVGIALVLLLGASAPGPYTHLHFTGISQTARPGNCIRLSVITTDDKGNLAPVPSDIHIHIVGARGFNHFSDSLCTVRNDIFTISAGQSLGTFYIETRSQRDFPVRGDAPSIAYGRGAIDVVDGTKHAQQIVTIERR
jgi:hypothetical protein